MPDKQLNNHPITLNGRTLYQLVSVVENIASLYSGEAVKGDPTEIRITGHQIFEAQQALKQFKGTIDG